MIVEPLYPEYSTNYNLLLTAYMKRPVSIYPDDIGIVYRNPASKQYTRLKWRDWYNRTGRLAKVLRERFGVEPGKARRPGDRIGTLALNTHRHMELYYAIPCCGAVLNPINVRLSPEHVVHTINHSQDKILFVDAVFWPLLEKIYDRIKDTVKAVVYMSDIPGLPETKIKPVYDYETLIREEPQEIEWPDLHEDTYATIIYTTGTTGMPKGVMFTHRQLYLQNLHVIAGNSFDTDPSVPHLGEAEVPILITPMFHAHGWGLPFVNVLSANKIVMPGAFTPEGFCELVQQEKVTNAAVTPTVLAMIIEYQDLDRYDFSSLRTLAVGGGPLTMGLKMKAEKLFPSFKATSGYGSTESGRAIRAFVKKTALGWPAERLTEIGGKTGLPVPGVDLRVVDKAGNQVPGDDETLGEIILRSPWAMGQYLNDPEKTAEVWRDGWFHTGDMAKVDSEGYITIADRISDMIRSGQEMVPTVLLENLTATAEYIMEAAFVGIPDEKWGQRPMAIVTLVPGAKQVEKDVFNYLKTEGVEKGKITTWMLPDYILITSKIPKTSVGKFDKIAIKRQLSELLPSAKKVK
jgi:acyl-CoA synthetase (AMP-forming)/AMP-acid ligase II